MKKARIVLLSVIFICVSILSAGSLKAKSDDDAYQAMQNEKEGTADNDVYWATQKEKEASDRKLQAETAEERPQISAGMTKEQVTEILGEPRIVNRLPTKDGNVEQWSYGHPAYGTNKYIYFDERGTVTGIQEE